MSMSWYRELITSEYLKLEENIKVDKFKLQRLANGADLVVPTLVNLFPNAVFFRNRENEDAHTMLYDVCTSRLADEKFKLTAKIYETIDPFNFEGTEEEIGENFIILKHSATMIHAMKSRRADSKKKTTV